ncbi:MAG: hypothetical protein QOF71_1069, partial [Candidatus Eremiobacteraeota bacterium]|nr:hypothetical protein [Candidatus Eremiobacteraeota bacterium]
GVIVPKNKRRTEGEYFEIAATVGGEYAAQSCADPDNAAAEKVITSEKVGPREGYTVVSTK